MMDEHDPAAEHRRAQATQWFARLKSVPVSKGTLEDFFEWRRDPANAEAFAQAEALWDDACRIGDRPAILRLTREAMPQGPADRRPIWGRRPLLALGAAVLLAVLVSSWWILNLDRTENFVTATGEQKALSLADGSHLRLDTETRLDAQLKRDEREIRLDHGQAMFEVAHDRARPFRVKAGDVEIEATGTRFDVRFVDGMTRVSLFEGGVDIRVDGQDTVRLSPGEVWDSRQNRSTAISPVDARRAAAWTQGRVVFDATPLDEAIAEMNRYTTKKLILAAPGRGVEPISGSFTTKDSSGFLKAVAALLSLRIDRQADGNVILREPSLSSN